MKSFPLANSGGSSTATPQVPGYVPILRGVLLSIGPFVSVTGPAQFSISQIDNQFGGSPGQITLEITPSTTESLQFPLDFGSYGIRGMGPNSAITLVFTPYGSDTPGTVFINYWGELTNESVE